MRIFYHFGNYWLMMNQVFSKPDKWRMFWRQLFRELESIGVGSLGIAMIITTFMGAVVTLQTSYNIESAFIPKYAVGFAARESIILEFSSSIAALILAGKIGSNIASQIGTMRVSEQIDALEIMGINSARFLVLPKIIAAIFIFPFITIICMFSGICGGWIAGEISGRVETAHYMIGLYHNFKPYNVFYSIFKSIFFAYIITSVSSYHGYYTKGGALEIGQSSTNAVVYSSVAILIVNYILTQLMLS